MWVDTLTIVGLLLCILREPVLVWNGFQWQPWICAILHVWYAVLHHFSKRSWKILYLSLEKQQSLVIKGTWQWLENKNYIIVAHLGGWAKEGNSQPAKYLDTRSGTQTKLAAKKNCKARVDKVSVTCLPSWQDTKYKQAKVCLQGGEGPNVITTKVKTPSMHTASLPFTYFLWSKFSGHY